MTGNIHGFASVDARTGREVERVGAETSPAELDDLCARAAVAARELAGLGRAGRARLLRSMARSLEERRADLVAVADRETALGEQRLNGELTRTCYQLDLFADVAEDGAYLEATIDHAGKPRWDHARTCAGCWSRSDLSRCSGRATSRSPSPCPAATPPLP